METTNYSRYGASQFALETNWANLTTHTGLQVALVASTAFVYRISATRDRVIVNLSNAPTQLLYCGFYTPTSTALAYQGASCIPLITCRLTSGSNAASSTTVGSVSAAVTRMPKYPDLSTTYVSSGSGWGTSVFVFSNGGLLGGRAGDLVHPATGDVAFTPMYVGLGNNSTGLSLGVVGNLDGVIAGYTSAAATLGDTVVYGGDTYTISQPTSQSAHAFKQV